VILRNLINGLKARRAANTKTIITKQHLLDRVVDVVWLQVEAELDAGQEDTQLLLHTRLLLHTQPLLHTKLVLHTQHQLHIQHQLYTQHLPKTKPNILSEDVLLVAVSLIVLAYLLIRTLPQQ
jgi:hypothetical protein